MLSVHRSLAIASEKDPSIRGPSIRVCLWYRLW